MRQIVFRGRKTYFGEWVMGYYFFKNYENADPLHIIIDCEGQYHIVDPDTVGQFTGLYDATAWEDLSSDEQQIFNKCEWRGRMIFEGDILEAHYDERYPEDATRTVVIWSQIGFQDHGIGWYMKQRRCVPDPLEWADAKRNKVICNIHENPDLVREVLE